VVVVPLLAVGALIRCIPVAGWVWLVEYSPGYFVGLLGGQGIQCNCCFVEWMCINAIVPHIGGRDFLLVGG